MSLESEIKKLIVIRVTIKKQCSRLNLKLKLNLNLNFLLLSFFLSFWGVI